MSVSVRIHHTARKHGIDDADMVHALRYSLVKIDQSDEMQMRVGPDRSGRLLEIGVLGADGDDPVIIHAMPMRAKFERFLP